MLRTLKHMTLEAAGRLGIFERVADSEWRRQRLVILCYHGISLRDEHRWSELYVSAPFLRRRLELLRDERYRVLPLGEALKLLRQGSLPHRSVAITFDDGFYDFKALALPLLHEFNMPATVYQTTYYCNYAYPIFNLVVRYLFWREPGRQVDAASIGAEGETNLSVASVLDYARRADLTPAQKNEVAARLAAALGVDYSEIMKLRMFQLMTREELGEISASGIDLQLHTHRHRTPDDEALFRREIGDNRAALDGLAPAPVHFCYPSGVWTSNFFPWLEAESVVSATTCEMDIVSRDSHFLALPRVLDSENITEANFRALLSGVAHFLPRRDARTTA